MDAWAMSVDQLIPTPGKSHARLAVWRRSSLVCTLVGVSASPHGMLGMTMDCTLQPLPTPIIGFCPGGQPLDVVACAYTALA